MSSGSCAADETFCTIMSTLTFASASAEKMRAGIADLVGHADHGDLRASPDEWVTPVMSRLFHESIPWLR